MKFTKMQGAGNDYIYLNCFAQEAPANPAELARRMSNRRFGVGGDGLILICPSDRADAEMRVFNADGSAAEMCGNGIRCVAKYLYDHGICQREALKIESAGRVLSFELQAKAGKVDRVRVDMGEPILRPADIPTTLRSSAGPDAPILDVPMEIGGRKFAASCVSMGNPHCIVFVDELTDDWVLGIGPQIEVAACFPKRINVMFPKVLSRREIQQRTWERGSGETLACGSGACGVCVAAVLTGRCDRQGTIHLRGGDLAIDWNEATNHVFMTGPAVEVFSGEWSE
jgi:diaminopimelate epimerase